MSTAENTTPAALPAAVIEWLAAADLESDTRFSVEMWTGPELVAQRGPWKLWMTADGQGGGLDSDGAGLSDLGPEWAHNLYELAALLADPRVKGQIERCRAERIAAILAPSDARWAAEEGGA